MTDEFVLSQMNYYRRMFNAGHPRDWGLIRGLLEMYTVECNKRGLRV